jgi:hypothetical protein
MRSSTPRSWRCFLELIEQECLPPATQRQAVTHGLVVDVSKQQQCVRLGQQLLMQCPAHAPCLFVAHVGCQFGHGLSVPAVNGDPQRFDAIQILSAARAQAPLDGPSGDIIRRFCPRSAGVDGHLHHSENR